MIFRYLQSHIDGQFPQPARVLPMYVLWHNVNALFKPVFNSGASVTVDGDGPTLTFRYEGSNFLNTRYPEDE